jgi:hypothetical protein
MKDFDFDFKCWSVWYKRTGRIGCGQIVLKKDTKSSYNSVQVLNSSSAF